MRLIRRAPHKIRKKVKKIRREEKEKFISVIGLRLSLILREEVLNCIATRYGFKL